MKTPNPKCEYENDGERITQPGKFEGEPVFAPHYWNCGLEGFADSDDGHTYTFRFTSAELAQESTPFRHEISAWLGRNRTLKLYEDSAGFVHCV